METVEMHKFKAKLEIIGYNPFVDIPKGVLTNIFSEAGKDRGPIQVSGTINGKDFKQTIVKYSGDYRLYINTKMLKNSPKRIGERVEIEITYDPRERTIQIDPGLQKALNENPEAKRVFESLPKSRQKEIIRYISSLKTEASIEKNIKRAIGFLIGDNRFAGRAKP